MSANGLRESISLWIANGHKHLVIYAEKRIMMKFKELDKTVTMQYIPYIDNIFYFEDKLKLMVSTVVKATPRMFTIYDRYDIDDNQHIAPSSCFAYFLQDNGRCLSKNNHPLYHYEKDKKEITNIVQNEFNRVYTEILTDENNAIKKLEDDKKRIDKKIQDIKNGKMTYPLSKTIRREFVENSRSSIENMLDIELGKFKKVGKEGKQ